MRTTRRRLLGTIVAAGGALLASCGGGGTTPTPAVPTATPASGGAATPTPGSLPTPTPVSQRAATPTAAAARRTIKIGLLVQLTGVYAALGQEHVRATQLLLDWREGKLGGFPVELLVEDEGQSVEDGLNKALKLVQRDRVDILAGILKSTVLYAVRDIVHEAGLPLIGTTAGPHRLIFDPQLKSPYIWRTSYANGQLNYPMGEYAYSTLGYRRVVVMATDHAGGREHASGFMKRFRELGGEIVGELYAPLDTVDFAPYFQQLGGYTADAVWAWFAGADALRFVTQWEDFGLKGQIPLIGSGWVTDEPVLPEMGEAAEGIVTSFHYSPFVQTVEMQNFVSAFRQRHDAWPGVTAYNGYIFARVLEEALSRLDGDYSRDAFLRALGSLDFQGPTGRYRMDPETQGPILTVFIRRVQRVQQEYGNVVVASFPDVPDRVART
ncbi:MAG: ABC transporter substrate-binding protein [Thermomicrobium sp.]|nr:ABC transporter substrate-binding protein [Thermomicrobium sp.]MDW8060665.1 ABC transporter substrate-binding protein [Thermomicrobium sp.]